MNELDSAVRRWRQTLTRVGIRSQDDLDELEDHWRFLVEENLAAGLELQQVLRIVGRHFGRPEDLVRDWVESPPSPRLSRWKALTGCLISMMRRISMATLTQDLRFALRTMMRQPGFTAVVVLTLAVGIGATTAMFGAVNETLLSSLPFDEPDRLVMCRATFDGRINPYVSGYDYYDYRDQNESFESLAALLPRVSRFTILGGAEPERVDGEFITWDLFPTLRVSPALGRMFTEEDGVEGGPNVVMISYGYWQRRFGGSPDVLGSTLIVDGSPHTVVGVMPNRFHFLNDTDVWRLIYYNGPWANARRRHNLILVGRLKPGITIRLAQAEVDTISSRLEEQYPDTNEGKALLVTGLHDAMLEDMRTSLLMLMAAVSLLLLLACGNAAGLLLARGQTRLKEIAIRSAMGASRRRSVLQLLTESTLTAVVAGLFGVAFAVAFQGLLIRLLPVGQLGITRPDIDASVLLFALGVSIANGIVFGAVPALQCTSIESTVQLRAGTRATSVRGTSLLRSGLIVVQVAISTVLLIGAGLLIRSLAQQMNVNLGFNPMNVLTAELLLPDNDYPESEQRIAFFTSLVEEVKALPGVVSVGLINQLPIRNPGNNINVYPADQPQEEQQSTMRRRAFYRCVLPGYLRTMGSRPCWQERSESQRKASRRHEKPPAHR